MHKDSSWSWQANQQHTLLYDSLSGSCMAYCQNTLRTSTCMFKCWIFLMLIVILHACSSVELFNAYGFQRNVDDLRVKPTSSDSIQRFCDCSIRVFYSTVTALLEVSIFNGTVQKDPTTKHHAAKPNLHIDMISGIYHWLFLFRFPFPFCSRFPRILLIQFLLGELSTVNTKCE